jgi:hypothetical protein
MTKLTRIGSLTAVLLAGLTCPAEGRVISYAPVTARTATPAVQSRLDRRHLLVERAGATQGPWMGPICLACVSTSRLVVYDAEGIDEPVDVSPGGQGSRVAFAAALEVGGDVRLLVASDARLKGEPDEKEMRLLYSADTGTTWMPVSLPSGLRVDGVAGLFQKDVGGWVARERGANVHLGVAQTPFILVLNADGGTLALVAVDVEGRARSLARMTSGSATPLAGEDYDWKRFYVVADSILPGSGGSASGDLGKPGLFLVDFTGSVSLVLGLGSTSSTSSLYAWMAADGPTYVQFDGSGELPAPFGASHVFGVVRDGVFSELARTDEKPESRLFAIPSAYWQGAWILKRDAGPTVLFSHSTAQGLVTRWFDVTRPEVEALHAGTSGNRLLVQVHRPRQTPERRFLDPALAMWELGQPAPARYDELFLNEQPTKGFVRLDVDAVSTGRPFLFDSGEPDVSSIPAGGSGGGDVVQEWGVVKASLYQRLVIPATARASGVGGSTWRTDLVLRNPDDAPLPVNVRLLPNPNTEDVSAETRLVLAPGEIRLVTDALQSLFDLERGSGALLLVPEGGRSVDATSRTYNVGDRGTFGMGVGAVDLYATSSPNFPVTFAAALLGSGFRTNVIATDASGRGSLLSLSVAPASPDLPVVTFSLDAPVGKQRQLNGLAEAAGFPAESRGSLAIAPEAGEVIAGLTAIDNATNDPTWFGPDLPATVTRTIPALVHADGKNGAAFRSDLYLFNPTDETRSVSLAARDWQSPQTTKSLDLTLLPRESMVIRDALQAAFGLTGVAQVAFTSGGSFTTAEGIRATSRTYTATPGGGTYGHPVPPLNSFQSVTGSETLEILGPVQAPGFRTNLALVDLLPPGNLGTTLTIRVEIVDGRGRVADSFTTLLAQGAGVQLNDLFNARRLRSDLGPVLIRVSPSGGSVAAYATTIDNGTNDPTYFQAVLSASPD